MRLATIQTVRSLQKGACDEMKDRRRIAVLCAGVSYKSYQHMFLQGILSQAFALNYDVVVFSPFMSYDNQSEYQRGENRIFSLVDFSQFDAVIYAPASFNSNNLRDLVERLLLEGCGVPVVAIESDDPRFSSISVNDELAFAGVTDHMIDVHGCRRILCLTGFRGNLQAEARLSGFRKSMAAHGLVIPDGYEIYGDFWTQAAEKLGDDIADGKIEMPEAIVCGCDMAAITLCDRLMERGIRVPGDILIAGYDSDTKSAEHVPSITTYVRPLVRLGIEGVLRAHRLITGEEAPPVQCDEGRLVPAETCGCGKDFLRNFKEYRAEQRETETYRKLYEDVAMAEKLNACTTLDQLLAKIMEHFYLLSGWNDYYLCLCDEWDDLSKNTDDVSDYDDYTERMHLRISCTDKTGIVTDETFLRRDLFPALHDDRDAPRAYYVTPLHFNERCFGYTVYGYGTAVRAFDSLYHRWTRNVNNALEFIRIRNNFSSLNQRLFSASIRDALTGIFDRHGFLHYAPLVFEKAQGTPEKRLLVIAADLDLLKTINDSYGHVEGDNAITVVADALNKSMERGEIVARTGGDEFLIIGCDSYTEEMVQGYICYIQRYLERYNEEAGKPYEVGVSLGYVCETVRADDTLQQFLDEADARMYANKTARRKARS